MKGKVVRKKYYLYYSIAFTFVALVAFSPFYLQGRSFVRAGDGWFQHTKALAFYSRWLKSFAKAFFTGDWKNLPMWTFSTGYGANVIGTFHYYVLGDPFALISAFVSRDQIVNLYTVLIFARLYVAGIVFSELCFYTEKRNTIAVLSGAVLYVFTTNVYYTCVRHPFFCGMLVWFPLIVLGVERILKEKRYGLYIFSVFICAVSNFYFFYVTVLLTIIYVIWRIAWEFGLKRIREAGSFLLKLIIASLVGTGMSMGILLPVLKTFGISQRSGGTLRSQGHLSLNWIVKWFLRLISWRGQDEMGFMGITIAAVFLLFLSWKRDWKWKTLALIIIGCCYSLSFRYLISGFSYLNGRWLLGLALPMAYMFVVAWDRFLKMKPWQTGCLLLCMFAYIIASRVLPSRSEVWSTRTQALLAVVFIVLIYAARTPLICNTGRTVKSLWSGLLVTTVCLSCAMAGYFRNAPSWIDYSSQFLPYKDYISTYANPDEESMEKELADRDAGKVSLYKTEAFPVRMYLGAKNAFRYSSLQNLTFNANVLEGTAADQFYWSMANKYVDDWLRELGATNGRGYQYSGVQGRLMPLALTGIRYAYAKSPIYAPAGYQHVAQKDNPMDALYPYYKNPTPLSLGILFDQYISREDYDSMDAVQRQQALLQGVVLSKEDVPSDFSEAKAEFSDEDIPYSVSVGDGVTAEGERKFIVTEAGSKIHFAFQGKTGGETYLYLTGLDVVKGKSENKFQVIGIGSDGTQSSLSFAYFSEDHKWTDHKHDYLVHTGQAGGQPFTGFDLIFQTPGTYVFSEMRVVFQPLEEAQSQIGQLAENTLQDINFHEDGTTFSTSWVTGKVHTKNKSVLFLSIPWNEGWNAYVDGKKTELFQVDTAFSGLTVEEGDHEIILRYRTPGLTEGVLISAISCAGWFLILIWKKKARC